MWEYDEFTYSAILCLENDIVCSEQMTGQLILCEAEGDEKTPRDLMIISWAPWATQN